LTNLLIYNEEAMNSMCNNVSFIIKIQLLILVGILIPICGAEGFYSGGQVNDVLEYKDLQVSYKSTRNGQRPWKVSGYIVNTTSSPVDFSCRLFFNSYFDHRTAVTKIRVEIPADGKAYFEGTICRVGEEAFSDSKVEWDVATRKGKKKKAERKEVGNEESRPVTMTEIRNGYRFEGEGTQMTDRFFLEAGVVKASVSYQGNKRIKATLLHEEGGRGKSIVNDTGIKDSTTGVSLRKAGYHFLSVRSSGKWRIDLEMAGTSSRSDGAAAGSLPVGKGTFPYEVVMYNGEIIPVDWYLEDGGRVTISRFGSQTTVNKETILKIVRK
jgi:hypothetical protein